MRVHHIYVLEFQIIQCMYLTKRRILRILIKVKTKNPSWFFKARLARQYMTFKPLDFTKIQEKSYKILFNFIVYFEKKVRHNVKVLYPIFSEAL